MFPALGTELDPGHQILQLRAQWRVRNEASGQNVGSGESSWSFIQNYFVFADQAQALWEHWRDNVMPFWMARRTPDFKLIRVLVEDRYPHIENDLVVDLDIAGEGPGVDNAPVQSSPVVTWRSIYPGRSHRGRTFWGPIAAEDLESPVYNGDLINAVDDWAFWHLTSFEFSTHGTTDPKFVIVSLQHNGIPEPVGRYVPVANFFRPHYLAVVRRRQNFYRGFF